MCTGDHNRADSPSGTIKEFRWDATAELHRRRRHHWVSDLIIGSCILGIIIILAGIIMICLLRLRRTVQPHGQQAANPMLGLDRSQIKLFPVTIFSDRAAKADEATLADEDMICDICLESYEPGQPLRTLTCAHMYHVACIDKWLSSNRTCPRCRQEYPVPVPV